MKKPQDEPAAPVTVRRLPQGMVYALPRRPLGGMRWAAAVLVLFGIGFAAGPLAMALPGVLGSSATGAFDWFFLVASVPFAAAGGLIAIVGLGIWRGHTEIEVSRDRVAAVERLGPLSWRRARAAKLARVSVARGLARVNGRAVLAEQEGPVATTAAMMATFDGADDLLLAVGYPEPWLLDLAGRMRRDHEIEQPADLLNENRLEVVRVEPGEDGADRQHVPPPAGSLVQLQDSPDGVTLTIPPAGLLKGSKGLFVFGILWCAFTAAISGAMFAAEQSPDDMWPLLIFFAIFVAVGIGMIVMGVNMGRRHAIIDVVDDVLLVNRKNIFGLRSHQWRARDIADIRVGPSGMEVNEHPVMELKIRPTAGKAVGLFAGRDERELAWIACVLRDRLAA